jgi:hypothetical protein
MSLVNRVFVLCMGIVLLSALPVQGQPAQSQENAPAKAKPHCLGPLCIGLSRKEVEALHYRFRTYKKNLEGDDYVVDKVYLGNGITIEATFDNDLIGDLSTCSPKYINKEGAHAGNTLAELKQVYPSGYYVKGAEEGLYFTFVSEVGGQYFTFDTRQLKECIVEDKNCPKNIEKMKSLCLYVR